MQSKHNRSMKDKLAPVGAMMYNLRAARFYHNGDGAGFVWNWWNPVVWIAFPFLFIFSVLCYGLFDILTHPHEMGLGVDPYFKEHPEQLIWE